MSIANTKQALGQGGMKEKPEKAPTPAPKEEKKDTSGFGGKPNLPGEQFRQWLRRPDLYSTGLTETERLEFEKEIRPKYGSYLERGEPERIKSNLEKERFGAKTKGEQDKIDKKIRLMKKFLGK